VWLKIPPETVWERVRSNLTERPLLAGAEDPKRKIRELLEIREPVYSLAHASVETFGKTPEEVSVALLNQMKELKPFDLSSLSL
jgi:shikimate kinase